MTKQQIIQNCASTWNLDPATKDTVPVLVLYVPVLTVAIPRIHDVSGARLTDGAR